ncbi:MAG: amidase [Deltaproteobacteria bacterium]|nr:amidase [Deltaproteobacteria bacterium]
MLDLSVTALARQIRARHVSPTEIVDAHIARIEQVNPSINAVVEDRFERAREEARAATEHLTRTDPADLPPLFGVPCTVKEFIAVEGMPHTGGLLARRGIRATEDATTVARLRAAGAIVLGVTNAPEGGLWMETHNAIYGRTSNPWDLSRTSGGSSGGEGAIVAAGGAPFGLGSDIGGSIRLPAAFCGTVGHKATGRLVPNTGQCSPLRGELSAYNTCGPLCRSAEDLMPLLRILAGPDGKDHVTRPMTLGDPAELDVKDLVVYPVETTGRFAVAEPLRRAVRSAARALEARGARVAELPADMLRRGFEIWSAMMDASGVSYAETLGDHAEGVALLKEVVRFPMGRSRHTGPALLVATAHHVARVLRVPTEGLIRAGRKLRTELEALLGERGVLLHPPYTRTAPPHHAPLLRPFDMTHTALFNVLELPVTLLPMGFDGDGLPVGLQIVARGGNDHVTIATACALEEDFGGWIRAEPQRLKPSRSLVARVTRRLDRR